MLFGEAVSVMVLDVFVVIYTTHPCGEEDALMAYLTDLMDTILVLRY